MKDLRASKILKSDNHISNFERFCKNYSGTKVKIKMWPECLQSFLLFFYGLFRSIRIQAISYFLIEISKVAQIEELKYNFKNYLAPILKVQSDFGCHPCKVYIIQPELSTPLSSRQQCQSYHGRNLKNTPTVMQSFFTLNYSSSIIQYVDKSKFFVGISKTSTCLKILV